MVRPQYACARRGQTDQAAHTQSVRSLRTKGQIGGDAQPPLNAADERIGALDARGRLADQQPAGSGQQQPRGADAYAHKRPGHVATGEQGNQQAGIGEPERAAQLPQNALLPHLELNSCQ